MRDVRGIGFFSIALAAYEAYAFISKRPTVTHLSHRKPFGFLIWGWLIALGYHFFFDATHRRR